MYVLLVTLTLKPEAKADFLELIAPHRQKSEAEPGCARFEVFQDQENADKYVLLEVYQDADAMQAHRETPHYAKWAELTKDWFIEKQRFLLKNIHPSDLEWVDK